MFGVCAVRGEWFTVCRLTFGLWRVVHHVHRKVQLVAHASLNLLIMMLCEFKSTSRRRREGRPIAHHTYLQTMHHARCTQHSHLISNFFWRRAKKVRGRPTGGAPGPGPLHRLDVAKGKNLCFTLCVYTQYTRNFQEKSIMGKNGYFFSPLEISIPPLSRVCQRWPLPWLVGHCTDKQRALGSIPSGSKSPLLNYKGLEGVLSIFSPLAHQESTMQRQMTCRQF